MAGIYGSTDSRRSLGQSAEQGDFLSCHSGLGLVPCDCHPALTFSPTHQWAVRSRSPTLGLGVGACPAHRWPTRRHRGQADPTPPLLRAPHSFFLWPNLGLDESSAPDVSPPGSTWGPSHAVTSGRWLSFPGLEHPPLPGQDGAERPQGLSGDETSSLAQNRSSECGSC